MSEPPQSGGPSREWRQKVAALTQETDRAHFLAFRVTSSHALAEEAVQEAFVRLLERPLDGMDQERLAAYLLKTVHNIAIDIQISARARKRREEKLAVTQPKTTSALDHAAQQTELMQAARAALEELDQDERVAVNLCCEQNLTRKVVSEILAIPERTISSRVERGLAHLKERLKVQGFASATPLLIVTGLRQLGVPPAPSSTLTALNHLVQVAAPKSLAVAGRKISVKAVAVKSATAKAVAGAAGLKIAAGVTLALASATTVAIVANKKTPPPPAAAAALAQAPVKPVAPPIQGEVVFKRDFEALAAGDGTPNKFIRLQEPEGEITALVSQPFSGGTDAWKPEVSINLWTAGGTPLFTVPKDMGIRLRIKSEKPGHCYVELQPVIRQSKEEGISSSNFDVTAEWQEIVLRAADFTPYRRPTVHTPDLAPGLGINDLDIYGYGTSQIFVDKLEVIAIKPDEKLHSNPTP